MLSMKRTWLSIPVGLAIGCGAASFGCSPGPNAVSTAGPAATSGGAASTAPGARVVEVEANQGWQDTGIRVAPKQRFQLRYRSGQITDKDTKIARPRQIYAGYPQREFVPMAMRGAGD